MLFARHRGTGAVPSCVRPTSTVPLNTRNNETFVFDRLVRGRPVLVPGHGGWLRQFGHVEDLADAIVAMPRRARRLRARVQRHGRGGRHARRVRGGDRGRDEAAARAPARRPALLEPRTSRWRSGRTSSTTATPCTRPTIRAGAGRPRPLHAGGGARARRSSGTSGLGLDRPRSTSPPRTRSSVARATRRRSPGAVLVYHPDDAARYARAGARAAPRA